MTAELMKRELLDMLPRFYDESPEVDAIMDVNARMDAQFTDNARDLLAQMHVETATWGLSLWERELELPPRPNSTLANRRARILARLAGTAPATVAYLTNVVNAHVADKSARIVEVNGEYRFNIVVNATESLNITNLYANIDEIKPAHIDYSLTQISGSKTYFAMAVTAGEEIAVYPWSPSNIEVSTSVGLGAIAQDFDTTSVYPKQT